MRCSAAGYHRQRIELGHDGPRGIERVVDVRGEGPPAAAHRLAPGGRRPDRPLQVENHFRRGRSAELTARLARQHRRLLVHRLQRSPAIRNAPLSPRNSTHYVFFSCLGQQTDRAQRSM